MYGTDRSRRFSQHTAAQSRRSHRSSVILSAVRAVPNRSRKASGNRPWLEMGVRVTPISSLRVAGLPPISTAECAKNSQQIFSPTPCSSCRVYVVFFVFFYFAQRSERSTLDSRTPVPAPASFIKLYVATLQLLQQINGRNGAYYLLHLPLRSNLQYSSSLE